MKEHAIDTRSLIGGRAEQQDAFGHVQTPFGLFALVCDGMGGANGGATASSMAIKIILDELSRYDGNNPVAAIKQAIETANNKIYKMAQIDPSLRGMGTTVAALLLQDHHATTFHAGDSRVYQIRKGKKYFRTQDHSRVYEMVNSGLLTEEEARLSEESNIILRALGINSGASVEIHDNLPYRKKDRFLLCTDGISGVWPEEQLLANLKNADITAANFELAKRADQAGRKNGNKHDNLTSILIECANTSGVQTKLATGRKLLLAGTCAITLVALFFLYRHVWARQNNTNGNPDPVLTLPAKQELKEEKNGTHLNDDTIFEKKNSGFTTNDLKEAAKKAKRSNARPADSKTHQQPSDKSDTLPGPKARQ